MKITIGRTVLYVLDEADAAQINRRRTTGSSIAERITLQKWPLGAQAHIGNYVTEGEIYPAVCVRVFGDSESPLANFQVLLDGCDNYWATSRAEDAEKGPGSWHFPERIA